MIAKRKFCQENILCKLSRNFQICVDSGDARSQVIQFLENSEKRQHNADSVRCEWRYTSSNEARTRRMREIQRWWRG